MKKSNADILTQYLPPKLVGAGFMLLWALSFSTAMTLTKTLDPETPSLVVLFCRCLFGLMFFLPAASFNKEASYKTKRPVLHVLRTIFLCSAMFCTYYAYRNLPLGLATSIGMSAPLFTTLLSILLLKDHVSLEKWAVIIMGYVGVLIMVQPDVNGIPFAVWVELLANIFAACSIITVKIMTRTESTATILFYSTLAPFALTTIAVSFVWEMPKPDDLAILVVVGGLAMLSHYCSATALRYANPSYLGPFEYTRMCFAIPIGFAFFDEIPTTWMLVGSAIIILATSLLTRIELKHEKLAAAATKN